MTGMNLKMNYVKNYIYYQNFSGAKAPPPSSQDTGIVFHSISICIVLLTKYLQKVYSHVGRIFIFHMSDAFTVIWGISVLLFSDTLQLEDSLHKVWLYLILTKRWQKKTGHLGKPSKIKSFEFSILSKTHQPHSHSFEKNKNNMVKKSF